MRPHLPTFARIGVSATVVIVPLVAATWLMPSGVPPFQRQVLLCLWGVGGILVAERLLFSTTVAKAAQAIGFVRPRAPMLVASLLVSLPMWVFLPMLAWTMGFPVALRADWFARLVGVILVNGIAEEVIHRGFVFGRLRPGRRFSQAATLSALVFAAQHLYLIVTMGWTVGLASVLLAALLAFPLAFAFERGGDSIGGPAILHTGSNAPAIIFALPDSVMATGLVPHMAVVLVSLSLLFVAQTFLPAPRPVVGPAAGSVGA